jgi:hypothetical protein
MSRHRRKPLDWDCEGARDGVVVYDQGVRAFVRYLDRNGEYRDHVASPKAFTIADIMMLKEGIEYHRRRVLS